MTEKQLYLITNEDGEFIALLRYMEDVNEIMDHDDDELQIIPIGT